MINEDILYIMKQTQIQKCIGELKALTMMYYNPMTNINTDYKKISEMVEKFENELTDNFG